jgi:hypothetical protein
MPVMRQDRNIYKRMRRHRNGLRLLGSTFALVGGLLFISGIWLLLDPESTITVNGEPTTSVGAKLHYTVFSAAFLGVGLFFLCAKARVLDKLFVWRQSFLSLFSRVGRRAA